MSMGGGSSPPRPAAMPAPRRDGPIVPQIAVPRKAAPASTGATRLTITPRKDVRPSEAPKVGLNIPRL